MLLLSPVCPLSCPSFLLMATLAGASSSSSHSTADLCRPSRIHLRPVFLFFASCYSCCPPLPLKTSYLTTCCQHYPPLPQPFLPSTVLSCPSSCRHVFLHLSYTVYCLCYCSSLRSSAFSSIIVLFKSSIDFFGKLAFIKELARKQRKKERTACWGFVVCVLPVFCFYP